MSEVKPPDFFSIGTESVHKSIVERNNNLGGGISLAKSPQEIRLSEVIGLLEGSLALVKCVTDPASCDRSEFCITRDIWSELKTSMDSVLEATTLQDMVERQKKKVQPMYFI